MRKKEQAIRGVSDLRKLFNGVAVTAASLYLTTHSTAVTVTATVVAAGLNGWGIWLLHRSADQVAVGGPLSADELDGYTPLCASADAGVGGEYLDGAALLTEVEEGRR